MLQLIEHIDAVITIAVGVGVLIYCWRDYSRLQKSKNLFTRNALVLGLILVLSGIGRIVIKSQLNSAPQPTALVEPVVAPPKVYTWKTAFTDDKHASAKFPGEPRRQTETYLDVGGAAKRHTIDCRVPDRNINLILSDNVLSPGSGKASAEEIFDGMVTHLTKEGYQLISRVAEQHGDAPGCRLVLEKDNGKLRSTIRIAIASKTLYRAIAVSVAPHHNEPVIDRFLDSFTLK